MLVNAGLETISFHKLLLKIWQDFDMSLPSLLLAYL